jgi:hypothetical protein
MTSTAQPNKQPSDLEALRSTGGADIPENMAPPQKMTDPKKHYTLCVVSGLVGAATLALGIFGAFGTPYARGSLPLAHPDLAVLPAPGCRRDLPWSRGPLNPRDPAPEEPQADRLRRRRRRSRRSRADRLTHDAWADPSAPAPATVTTAKTTTAPNTTTAPEKRKDG